LLGDFGSVILTIKRAAKIAVPGNYSYILPQV